MFFSTAYARLLHSGDSALAGRAAQGDRDAQREIFHALQSTVHATLYRVLGSNEHIPAGANGSDVRALLERLDAGGPAP